MTPDLHALRDWIGRTETRQDLITARPIIALAALLDRDDPPPAIGDPIPPAAHWLYFLSACRHSELGRDGHAQPGSFLPPVGLPRRMWGGSRMQWHHALRVGDRVTRTSRVEDVVSKEGRSGQFSLVRVRHEYTRAAGLALIEEQDIIYREAAQSGRPDNDGGVPAPEGALHERVITPDPVLLFRYSALTFNGHRIHYDLPFARQEGYPGLVVHGPLIATMLLDMLRSVFPDRELAQFGFRAVRPVFDTQSFSVCCGQETQGTVRLWAMDGNGLLAIDATATLR